MQGDTNSTTNNNNNIINHDNSSSSFNNVNSNGGNNSNNPLVASLNVVGDAVAKTTGAAVKTTEAALKGTVETTKSATHTVVSCLQGGNSNDADKRWKELQRLEKKRRAILKRTEEPFWKTLLYWDGTVLSHLKMDSVLWLTMGLYVLMRVAAREGLPDFVSSLDTGRITIVGGFLTFFLVFYVNQSHKRFFGLYGHSMACKGRIFDAATLARSCHMPKTQALRLIRYMNAAHAAAYVGLSSVYPSSGYFDRVCFEQFKLLTPEEKQRLDEINMDAGGSAYRECIVWAMLEVQNAKDQQLIDRELAAMLRDLVLQLRAQAGQLYNAADLPVPFFYVHFICLLTLLYLPLFAVIQGINAGTGDECHWVVDVVAGLVVFVQAIFIIGLRIVGQKVSDPYGDDLVDLSVMFFIQFTWMQSQRVLASHDPPRRREEQQQDGDEEETELQLARERITIGAAWDGGTEFGLGSSNDTKKKGPAKGDGKDNNDQEDTEGGRDTSGEDDDSSNASMEEQMRFGSHEVK
mmetsp:Transcript_25302/g.47147  ORF Transcript_25302/g.47147 Transcript_25302/m.47147 type:complete len:520 (-) Transcript_25302:115-1674(-)